MADYRLRFQLQHGHDDVVSAATYNESYPCTRNTGVSLLEDLNRRGQADRSDSSWKNEVNSAIERMKSWVRNAHGLSAHSGSAHSESFRWHDYTFRIDLEINAGTHFNS